MTNVVPELWNQELLKSFTESMMAAGMVNTDNERKIVEKIANQLLPKVCVKHVYRIEHQRSMQMIDNCEYVYISWTFYNDQRVRLKARVNREDEISVSGWSRWELTLKNGKQTQSCAVKQGRTYGSAQSRNRICSQQHRPKLPQYRQVSSLPTPRSISS